LLRSHWRTSRKAASECPTQHISMALAIIVFDSTQCIAFD